MSKISPLRLSLLVLTGLGTAIGFSLLLLGISTAPPVAWFEDFLPTTSIGPANLPVLATMGSVWLGFWPHLSALLFTKLISIEIGKTIRAHRAFRKR